MGAEVTRMSVMVFDIETVPDIAGGRRLLDLDADLCDADVAQAMYQLRRQAAGTDFLRPHLHRIVAISVVLRRDDGIKVWSLGDEQADEAELITRFFDGLDRFGPTLVSWNGGGFDLPVLNYRALVHGIAAPRYWETGERDPGFRYSNYLSRFHWRHVDLMDVLAGYQARMVAPLDEVAALLGFPGKMGMHGSKVWEAYQAGDIAGIRDYCETDVLNTYLVWLRFQLMRGHLDADAHAAECERLTQHLHTSGAPHLVAFAKAWRGEA